MREREKERATVRTKSCKSYVCMYVFVSHSQRFFEKLGLSSTHTLGVTHNSMASGFRHFIVHNISLTSPQDHNREKKHESSVHWDIHSSSVYPTVFSLTVKRLWMSEISHNNVLVGKQNNSSDNTEADDFVRCESGRSQWWTTCSYHHPFLVSL